MFINRKGISPVIATILFVIVSVISAVAFQIWYTSYSSSLFSDTEVKSQDATNFYNIDNLIKNTLYIKNPRNKNLTFNSITIGGYDCGISESSTESIIEFDVSDCVNQLTENSIEVVAYLSDKVISKKFYIEDINTYYFQGIIELELDLYEGSSSSYATPNIVYNNKLFLTGNNGTTADEIWSIDSSGNYNLIKDIHIGGSSYAYDFFIYNNKIYFTATNGSSGYEIAVSDGTESGTYILKDMNVGSSYPEEYVEYNGNFYFYTDDDTYGNSMYVSNGTTDGTGFFHDVNFGGGIEYNNLLYFAGDYELWTSNGSSSGTQEFLDINSGGNSFANNFFIYNNLLYFFANDGNNGTELWVTNGSVSGTYLAIDINVGSGSSTNPSYPGVLYNNKFYFYATNGSTGYELWATDGTMGGTQLIKDINPGSSGIITTTPSNIVVFNNKLYFMGNDGVNGEELWESDGTESGTQMVEDINPSGDSKPEHLVIFNNRLYFEANDGSNGRELFVLK